MGVNRNLTLIVEMWDYDTLKDDFMGLTEFLVYQSFSGKLNSHEV